jgi:hypothetical protein
VGGGAVFREVAMSKKLTIDPEFAGLCSALTPEESANLEASIASDGCRDEIVVWANHKDTILDGHNRYEICDRLGKPFKTTALRFDTREECVEWIVSNQLGRRNLSDEQKSYLRGKRYQSEKRADGGHGDQKSEGKSCPPITAERLADEFDVSPRTMKNDAAFAEAVDEIAEKQGPEAKAAILAGESLGKAATIKAAKLPKAKMAKAVKTGKLPSTQPEPKNGQQKKDPRLWLEIEGYLGKANNRLPELHRQYPHGIHHRDFQQHLTALGRILMEWKKAVA